MVKEYDVNGDGEISFEEFKTIFGEEQNQEEQSPVQIAVLEALEKDEEDDPGKSFKLEVFDVN